MVSRRNFIAGSAAALTAGSLTPNLWAKEGAVKAQKPTSGKAPTFTLNTGKQIPALGLGVWKSPPEETAAAVQTAIDSGYRLIDTAAIYGNETQVGEGIMASGVPREDLFITTKLWISDFGYDQALAAFDVSSKKLGLDYVDLYLLHWPAPATWEKTVAAWHALEKLHADGRIRSIGVSNFLPEHLEKLKKESKVTPAVNQIELNPNFPQQQLRKVNAQQGILTEAWSPIGGSGNVGTLLKNPVLTKLAAQLHKSPAQIILRWHFQNGLIAIPKSVHAERIKENIDIFDFELSEAQVKQIDGLDSGHRSGPDPAVFNGRK